MAKTELTKQLEKELYNLIRKVGTFACFEVTIGFNGKERVDLLTYNTKGIWRCYEIKVSKQDFYSKSAHTFVGHYNYFVMPDQLFKEVKKDIPKYVGVYVLTDKNYLQSVKKASKQKLKVSKNILQDSMIRSLYYNVDKQINSNNELIIDRLNRTINRLEKELKDKRKAYIELSNELFNLKHNNRKVW